MKKQIYARFDGKVFIPEDPVDLKPNTQVRLIIDISDEEKSQRLSFLQTALSLKLEGPPDWSTHLEDYLYGP